MAAIFKMATILIAKRVYHLTNLGEFSLNFDFKPFAIWFCYQFLRWLPFSKWLPFYLLKMLTIWPILMCFIFLLNSCALLDDYKFYIFQDGFHFQDGCLWNCYRIFSIWPILIMFHVNSAFIPIEYKVKIFMLVAVFQDGCHFSRWLTYNTISDNSYFKMIFHLNSSVLPHDYKIHKFQDGCHFQNGCRFYYCHRMLTRLRLYGFYSHFVEMVITQSFQSPLKLNTLQWFKI